MNTPTPSNHKVTVSHLQREAYLYVRQSSMRQVLENTESTKRQYQLRERALALGWISERIGSLTAIKAVQAPRMLTATVFSNWWPKSVSARPGW